MAICDHPMSAARDMAICGLRWPSVVGYGRLCPAMVICDLLRPSEVYSTSDGQRYVSAEVDRYEL